MLAFFGLSWLKVGFIAAGIAAIVALAAYEHHKIYKEGYTAAITDVQTANAKANSEAAIGQKDVEACFTAGKTWDRDTGTCN